MTWDRRDAPEKMLRRLAYFHRATSKMSNFLTLPQIFGSSLLVSLYMFKARNKQLLWLLLICSRSDHQIWIVIEFFVAKAERMTYSPINLYQMVFSFGSVPRDNNA